MPGYWKIEKDWVQKWGLTATECIVLADILTWQGIDGKGVTLKDRSQRCGVSQRQLNYILNSLLSNQNVIPIVQKLHITRCKNCTIRVQKLHNNGAKIAQSTVQKLHNSPLYPFNNVEEHIEEQEEREGSARTRTRETDKPMSEVLTLDSLFNEYRDELTTDTETALTAQRLYGLNAEQMAHALSLFRDKLTLDGVRLKARGDFRRHFNSWLKNNAKNIFDNGKQQQGPSDDFIRRTAEHIVANGGPAF